MKKILLLFTVLICTSQIKSQNFYHVADSIESVYANDTTEGGPRAKVERLKRLWSGQFNNAGKFTNAAQNYYSFSKGLVNHRTATTNCGDFVPNWKEIGPTMTNNNTAGFEGKGAGEINSMCFHPNYDGVNNQIIYALSVYGGIWKTVDDGENWTRLNTDNDIPFSSFGILVIDPINPNRMYVTTGKSYGMPAPFISSTSVYPYFTIGIYATDDGGNSWGPINNALEATGLFNSHCIFNLAIDPLNHDNLIFTSSNGVYICTNASGSIGSQLWTKDNAFTFSDNLINGLTYNPTSHVWFISGKDIYSCANPFITHTWISSTTSNGLDLSGGILHLVGIADPIIKINIVNSKIAGFDDDIYGMILTSTTNSNNTALVKKTGNGQWQVLKYFKQGDPNPLTPNTTNIATDRIAIVKSSFSNDIFFGSIYFNYYNSAASSVAKSYGNKLPGTYDGSHHADLDGLYIHHSQPNKLWLCGDGGISLVTIVANQSNATSFIYKNNGIQAHLLWAFDDSEQDPKYLLAALQDNGVHYTGGAAQNTWKMGYFGGDGFEASIFDKNPADAFVTGNEHFGYWFNYTNGLYSQTNNPAITMNLHRSDYFASPSNINDKILVGDFNPFKYMAGAWGSIGNYANPFFYLNYNNSSYTCPPGGYKEAHQNYTAGSSYYPAYLITNFSYGPSTCVTGANGLPSIIHKSDVGYDTWQQYNAFNNVNQITNALYDAAKVYDPVLGASAISAADIPMLTGITCNPSDGNKVWVCSASLNAGFKIWKSTDGGINWTNADPQTRFGKIPVFDVVALDGSLDMVFAGTLDGVYYTDNTMNGNWCKYGASPSVHIIDLKINYCKNKLIVTTYGRGAFEVDLPFQSVTSTDITSTQTWSTPQTFLNSVTVKTGKTLTIQNTTIKFGPNSRLYVEAGAKLIINNASLTSASECNGYLWKGIELQGNEAQKQVLSGSYYPNHGWCVITNNATIKNAEIGIKNYATINGDGWSIDWSKMGGGIIQSTNGKFLNCGESAKFISYTNKNALNQPINDKSFFTTTQFLTDATTAIANFVPRYHLTMWETRGIGITSNTFKNTTPSSYATNVRGIGIVAWDAIFLTNTPCLVFNGASDCKTYGTPNTFENLYYGIDAGASVATKIVNINVSKFTNTHRSIILRGTTQSSVFRNTINIGEAFTEPTGVGTAMAVSYPYGLYLDACDAYNVKENIINDNTNNAADIDYGIIVSNTGINANMLKQNTFSNVAYGIQAQEENYALQLKCNKFTAATINSADVKVMGLQMQGSIAQQQGLCNPLDPTQLPGNEFSHTCGSAKDLNSNGNVLYQVTYNTRGTVSQEVPQSGCYNTTDFNVNLCGNPPSGVVCAPPTGGHLRMAQNNASQQLQNMSNLIAAKQQLLADADAQSLYTSIHNGTPETTLKQNLMQVGPYLSDNILLAFLNHNPKYSYTTLKDVIIANSPVTESVMAAINQLSLPNMIKNQIMSSQTGISQRKYVQNEIKYYTTSRVLLYNDIINDVLNDSTNTAVYDTLYTKLDFIISPQSRNLYIGALMEQGKFGQAQAQIAIMRQTGETTENCDYLEAVLTLKQQANKAQAYKINASISSKINPLLSKWPLGKSVNANVLNSALFGKGYKEQIYMDKSSVKNQRLIAEEQLITPETELQVIAFPNPANTDVNFVIDGIAENEICAISIYDINGRLMTEFNVQENKLPKSVSLSTFSSGIYFYKAITGDKIYQNKLVIIK